MPKSEHTEELDVLRECESNLETLVLAFGATMARSGQCSLPTSTLRPIVESTVAGLKRIREMTATREPLRGVRWERMVDAGMKSGMNREASESHADKYAVRIASKLTTEEAAEEYSTALARELGLR
jgi:hypothetical protein